MKPGKEATTMKPGKEALSAAQKAHARTLARLSVVGAVAKLYEELRETEGLNQSRLAERLGCSRSHISRLLSGPGNWTLDTVGDLLAAMDAELTKVEAVRVQDIPSPNYAHAWVEGALQSSSSLNPPISITTIRSEEDDEAMWNRPVSIMPIRQHVEASG